MSGKARGENPYSWPSFIYQGSAAVFAKTGMQRPLPAGGNYIYSFPVSECEEVGDESELGNIWEDRYVQTFVN